MSKRIKQHQLEDLSRYKFGLAMPSQWVFRDKDKDYGIDGEVELFDQKEKVTGLFFLVQLKATSSKAQRIIKGLDLSLEVIKYYKCLDIPVLIARYSEVEDKFYVKWATQIDPFYAKNNAKTMRVNFSDSDMLDGGKIVEIEKYLQKLRAIKAGAVKLPININLSFGNKSICGISPSLLISKIRTQMLEFKDILRLELDEELISANVYIDEAILKVGFLDVAGCTFHSVDRMDNRTLPIDLVKDICLSLSIALSQLGYSDMAARIVFSSNLEERIKIKNELLEYLLPSLLKTSYFSETLSLVSDVCDMADSNYLEAIANSSLLHLRSTGSTESEEKLDAIESFLKRNVKRYEGVEPSLCGVSYYNLGNFYRSIGRPKDSVNCFLIARRYEPNYYNQEYFYVELAGSLFNIGKFYYSARFYKKAMEMDYQEEYLPFYADALMFSGQYQQSLHVFNEFLDDNFCAPAEWRLKSICLSSLIEKYNFNVQVRNPGVASELSDVRLIKLEDAEESLEKALSQDMLCGLAWFNLGDYKNNAGQIEEAAFCFTMCALVQRWDIEAWVNATVCSFNKVVPLEMFVLLVQAAYFCNGDQYIDSLYEVFESRFGADMLSEITIVVEGIIAAERKKENEPALRILNENGKFEDILSDKKVP